jgi:AAA ATPase domain/Protein of unknown function (DUF3696)
MLQSFSIGNFKAFGETQKVPIRPLTLIFGQNSAGKSSVIHGLLLARHALDTGELDVFHTSIGGRSVDLGGFRQYVHRRSLSSLMEWGADVGTSELDSSARKWFEEATSVGVRITVGKEQRERPARRRIVDPTTKEEKDIEVPSGVMEEAGVAGVQTYEITFKDHPVVRFRRKAGASFQLNSLDLKHPIFTRLLRSLIEASTTIQDVQDADIAQAENVVSSAVADIVADRGTLFPVRVRKQDSAGSPLQQPGLVAVRKGERETDLAAAINLVLPRSLDEFTHGVNQGVGNALRKLRYLGPLRSFPPRQLSMAQYYDPDWHAGGGFAWDVLQSDSRVRHGVNAWLSDPEKLRTPYRLLVREYSEQEAIKRALEEVYEGFSKEVTTFGTDAEFWQDADPKQMAAELLKSVSPDVLPQLEMTDIRFNTVVTHRDVGIGISQVIPVLVSAFGFEEQLIAIEQPEIHLHPGLQAELGDVFINSAMTKGNTFILETHSEHLILRILRRIRETTSGNLPKDVVPVRPEDVAVLYVQRGKGGAEVLEIPIRADGEFITDWPEGFFPERAEELF